MDTKSYYAAPFHEVCTCSYCENYIRTLEKTYPALCEKLRDLGIDPLLPFELIPFEPRGKEISYYAQYIIFEKPEGSSFGEFPELSVKITENHPSTDFFKEHPFVLEIGELTLPLVLPL